MNEYILERSFIKFLFFENQKISVFLQNRNRGGKIYFKKIYCNCATFSDFKRNQVSLIPYVYEKSFNFASILRQITLDYFEKEKILFVKNRYFYIFFSENERKSFGLLAKNFQQRCPNCNLHHQKNILRKKILTL